MRKCVRVCKRAERLTENTNLPGGFACKPFLCSVSRGKEINSDCTSRRMREREDTKESHHTSPPASISIYFYLIFPPIVGVDRSQSTCHEANFCVFLFCHVVSPTLKVHLLLSSFFLSPQGNTHCLTVLS